MILKVKSFRTPSGKRKQRGRNDMARLIPEAKEEAQNWSKQGIKWQELTLT
jgi:hypothetical protein